MPTFLLRIFGRILLSVGRFIARILLKVEIKGQHNVPRNEPLIVVSNHFSWFDGPILSLLLPVQPVFLIATESTRFWYFALFVRLFNLIPIWRGKVDRKALNQAISVLRGGGVIGVFPEGGIDPGLAEARNRGEMIEDVKGHMARADAKLAPARPGVAFLAVESKVRILPVALRGTENIWQNLSRLRRTPISISIGEPFGPLILEAELSGRDKRDRLNGLADMTMRRIARLFPPDRRGPYRDADAEIGV